MLRISARSPCSSPNSASPRERSLRAAVQLPLAPPHPDVPGCAAWPWRSHMCTCIAPKRWSSSCSTMRGRGKSANLAPTAVRVRAASAGPAPFDGCVQSANTMCLLRHTASLAPGMFRVQGHEFRRPLRNSTRLLRRCFQHMAQQVTLAHV